MCKKIVNLGKKLKNTHEILDYIKENLENLESIAKEEGFKIPLLMKATEKYKKNVLVCEYWTYKKLLYFIKEEI